MAGPTTIARDTCSCFSGFVFNGFSPLAILLSFASVSSFLTNNYDPLLLLDRAHNTNFSDKPSFREAIEVFNKVFSICSASIGRATSPDGSSTRAMSAITKQFYYWSIKVILLFTMSHQNKKDEVAIEPKSNLKNALVIIGLSGTDEMYCI